MVLDVPCFYQSFRGSRLHRLAMALAVICLFTAGCETTGPGRGDNPRSALDQRSALTTGGQLEYINPELMATLGSGTSMLPLFGEGTVIVLAKISYRDLEQGMNIAYRNRDNLIVIHQLIRQDRRGWVAKGINNPREDRERVTEDNLIGIVYTVIYGE